MKQLDYLDKIDYDKLPLSYRDNKKQFHSVSRTIKKLNNRKQKIKLEIKEINSELKSFKKQQTELFNDLKFINKNYNPKCYVVYDNKNGVDYLNLVVKHLGKSKPIYLGKPIKVCDKLKGKTKNLLNLNYNQIENFKNKLNTHFEMKIGKMLDYNNPNKLLTDRILFKDII